MHIALCPTKGIGPQSPRHSRVSVWAAGSAAEGASTQTPCADSSVKPIQWAARSGPLENFSIADTSRSRSSVAFGIIGHLADSRYVLKVQGDIGPFGRLTFLPKWPIMEMAEVHAHCLLDGIVAETMPLLGAMRPPHEARRLKQAKQFRGMCARRSVCNG